MAVAALMEKPVLASFPGIGTLVIELSVKYKFDSRAPEFSISSEFPFTFCFSFYCIF